MVVLGVPYDAMPGAGWFWATVLLLRLKLP
jgi:hypothetical protein